MQCKALPLPYISIAIHVHACTYRIHTQSTWNNQLNFVFTRGDLLISSFSYDILKHKIIRYFFHYIIYCKVHVTVVCCRQIKNVKLWN